MTVVRSAIVSDDPIRFAVVGDDPTDGVAITWAPADGGWVIVPRAGGQARVVEAADANDTKVAFDAASRLLGLLRRRRETHQAWMAANDDIDRWYAGSDIAGESP